MKIIFKTLSLRKSLVNACIVNNYSHNYIVNKTSLYT